MIVNVNSQWGDGYCAEMTITHLGDSNILTHYDLADELSGTLGRCPTCCADFLKPFPYTGSGTKFMANIDQWRSKND